MSNIFSGIKEISDINVEDWQASIKLLRELPVDALYLTHYGRIDAISEHLDTLERTLLSWAAWMRPHAEQKTPQEQLIECHVGLQKCLKGDRVGFADRRVAIRRLRFRRQRLRRASRPVPPARPRRG